MESAPPSPPPPPPLTLLDLPPNAVDEILIRLPLRDAVLTAALSREWRHRWKSIPELEFVNRTLPAAAISTILSLHSAPIRSFSLITDHSDHADTWLVSLSRRSVRAHYLCVSFNRHPPRHPLHPSAFSFHKTLTHLHLDHCSIDPPPSNGSPDSSPDSRSSGTTRCQWDHRARWQRQPRAHRHASCRLRCGRGAEFCLSIDGLLLDPTIAPTIIPAMRERATRVLRRRRMAVVRTAPRWPRMEDLLAAREAAEAVGPARRKAGRMKLNLTRVI